MVTPRTSSSGRDESASARARPVAAGLDSPTPEDADFDASFAPIGIGYFLQRQAFSYCFLLCGTSVASAMWSNNNLDGLYSLAKTLGYAPRTNVKSRRRQEKTRRGNVR